MSASEDIRWLETFLKRCSPRDEPFRVREPFQEDEATRYDAGGHETSSRENLAATNVGLALTP